LADIEIVALPTTFQEVPSVETDPVNRLPARARRTQYGALGPDRPVLWLEEFADTRRWKAAPFDGVSAMKACLEPVAVDSRIITPALAQEWVFCWLLTRATTSPSPDIGTDAKWNASAVPQMSAPEPEMVIVEPEAAKLPVAPTDPMSLDVQMIAGAGSTTEIEIGPEVVEAP
jgi:hypothetical protein